MKELVPYLMFDGECREAMQFYAAALGGELFLTTYNESQQGGPEQADRVMHAKVSARGGTLMASDMMPGMALHAGNNFWMSLDCDGVEEQDRLFAALGEGGDVTMPLQETFWKARFGMLKDRFGVAWMFNYDLMKG